MWPCRVLQRGVCWLRVLQADVGNGTIITTYGEHTTRLRCRRYFWQLLCIMSAACSAGSSSVLPQPELALCSSFIKCHTQPGIIYSITQSSATRLSCFLQFHYKTYILHTCTSMCEQIRTRTHCTQKCSLSISDGHCSPCQLLLKPCHNLQPP